MLDYLIITSYKKFAKFADSIMEKLNDIFHKKGDSKMIKGNIIVTETELEGIKEFLNRNHINAFKIEDCKYMLYFKGRKIRKVLAYLEERNITMRNIKAA